MAGKVTRLREDGAGLPLEDLRLADLKAHPDNYNPHSPEQIETLKQSIQRFGVYKPLQVSTDGYVLTGHGVAEAATGLGIEVIACHRMPWPHDHPEAIALMVTDNETQTHDEDRRNDQLSQLLESIRADSDAGLVGTGHDDESLAALLEEVANANPPTGYVPENKDAESVGHHCPACGYDW